jgi:hypothetical protein
MAPRQTDNISSQLQTPSTFDSEQKCAQYFARMISLITVT